MHLTFSDDFWGNHGMWLPRMGETAGTATYLLEIHVSVTTTATMNVAAKKTMSMLLCSRERSSW